MENREEEVYQKHRYQINIRECADKIIKNLRNAKNPSLLNITIEEYESRLNDAIEAYKDSINFDTIKSETNDILGVKKVLEKKDLKTCGG